MVMYYYWIESWTGDALGRQARARITGHLKPIVQMDERDELYSILLCQRVLIWHLFIVCFKRNVEQIYPTDDGFRMRLYCKRNRKT